MKIALKIALIISMTLGSLNLHAQEQNQTDCEQGRKQISILQNDIKTALESCKIEEAKRLINEINDKYAGCISLFQQDTQSDLLIAVIIKEKSLQQFQNLKQNIANELASNKCKEANLLLNRVKNDLKCMTNEMVEYIKDQEDIIKQCEDNRNLLTRTAEAKNQIANFRGLGYAAMEKSLAEIDVKLNNLERMNLNPSDLANLRKQQDELAKYMKVKEEEIDKQNKVNAITKYDKIFKPEFIIGISTTVPYFISNIDGDIEGAPTYLSSKNKFSYGIGLRHFNRRKGSGTRLGIKLEGLEMTFYDLPNDKLDKFEATNLNVELKGTIDGTKVYHPIYATYGFGAYIPMAVNYTNQDSFTANTVNFKKNDFMDFSIYSLLGLGTGLERKNLGISIEGSLKVGGLLSPFIDDSKIGTIVDDKFQSIFYGVNLSLLFRPF